MQAWFAFAKTDESKGAVLLRPGTDRLVVLDWLLLILSGSLDLRRPKLMTRMHFACTVAIKENVLNRMVKSESWRDFSVEIDGNVKFSDY